MLRTELDIAVEIAKGLNGPVDVLPFGHFDRKRFLLAEKLEGDLGETIVNSFWQGCSHEVRREKKRHLNERADANRVESEVADDALSPIVEVAGAEALRLRPSAH